MDGGEETAGAVREALDDLPEEQRTCLVLRVQEEMSYSQIAKAVGIAVGTVMSRLSRARMALREKLKKRAVL
jgi:RNA polymerase sigma-70 factor (ECF subfamily)